MLQISTMEDVVLDMGAEATININDMSPIFNDAGSQSLPATVPATGRNKAALGFLHRPDAGARGTGRLAEVEVSAGAYIRRGKINVTEASEAEGFTFNIGFDNSTAYGVWRSKKLADLSGLPVLAAASLPDELKRLYTKADPQKDPLAVFPIAIAKDTITENDEERTVWSVLNAPGWRDGSMTLEQPAQVDRIIDNALTAVSVPHGYGVTAFVRVWRVLELIFADLGVAVRCNPFKEDRELAMVVVLNSTADSCCTGRLNYADLMPDCTVAEFLEALHVRFGLVYNINYNTRRADLRLLKDVLYSAPQTDLTGFAKGLPSVTYSEPKYISLRAGVSLEGAEPLAERLEDFARGLDVEAAKVGRNVEEWQYLTEQESWKGDESGGAPDPTDPDVPDPEEPDPDIPEPDIPDDVPYAVTTAKEDCFLAREYGTLLWFKLDKDNSRVREKSSSFFAWDPQPEGYEEEGLSSVDESVPVGRASTKVLGGRFEEVMPLFLCGARHYHSYIAGADAEEVESMPLALMIAHTADGKTVGRFYPEDSYGLRPEGSSLSLLFQFADGLFMRYWSDFDVMCRHSARTVTVRVAMSKAELLKLDLLRPVSYGGVRCLIDTVDYDLGAPGVVVAEVSLRPMTAQDWPDLETEHRAPRLKIENS